MKRLKYAVILLLGLSMAMMTSCTKDPDNGGNGGGNNGGGNTYNGHEYVDLGLPSGTLWATCNVGADMPEGYGDYFAWGETTPKTTYNWITYKYSNYDGNGDLYYQITKYCNNEEYGYNGFTDNLTVLLPEDDAATAYWGSGWCMPTLEQAIELKNNTVCTEVFQDGVKGFLLTATNGKSLFLPLAGSNAANGLIGVGSAGDYWTSSLSSGYGARSLSYSSWGFMVNGGVRCVGRSVRPVRSR